MKKIGSIFLTVVIVVVALSFAKNLLAKGIVENSVKLVTGLTLKMKSLDVSLLTTSIGIKELQLQNPSGFPEKVMVDMPEIFVNYDLMDFMKGKVHLLETRIHLQEFVVVKNRDGKLNLDSLTALQEMGGKEKKASQEKAKGKAPEIQLDLISLKIGKVVFKDYSKGDEPSVKEFNINIDEEYHNITNPNHLVGLIVLKVMMKTPLAALTNFDISGLKSDLSGALTSATQMAGETAQKAKAVIKEKAEVTKKLVEEKSKEAKKLVADTSEKLSEAASTLGEKTKGLTSGLKSTAESLKGALKLPALGKE